MRHFSVEEPTIFCCCLNCLFFVVAFLLLVKKCWIRHAFQIDQKHSIISNTTPFLTTVARHTTISVNCTVLDVEFVAANSCRTLRTVLLSRTQVVRALMQWTCLHDMTIECACTKQLYALAWFYRHVDVSSAFKVDPIKSCLHRQTSQQSVFRPKKYKIDIKPEVQLHLCCMNRRWHKNAAKYSECSITCDKNAKTKTAEVKIRNLIFYVTTKSPPYT